MDQEPVLPHSDSLVSPSCVAASTLAKKYSMRSNEYRDWLNTNLKQNNAYVTYSQQRVYTNSNHKDLNWWQKCKQYTNITALYSHFISNFLTFPKNGKQKNQFSTVFHIFKFIPVNKLLPPSQGLWFLIFFIPFTNLHTFWFYNIQYSEVNNVNGGEGMQTWRAAVNKRNNQLWMANKRWTSNMLWNVTKDLGLGNFPWNDQRNRKWIRFGTWYVKSFYS